MRQFFQYADGGWVAKNEIPAAYPSWGRFNELADKNLEQLHQILEAAKNKSTRSGSNEQRIGDYYASRMDEAGIEAAGLKPLNDELGRMAAINDQSSFQAEVARLRSRGISCYSALALVRTSNSLHRLLTSPGVGLKAGQYRSAPDWSISCNWSAFEYAAFAQACQCKAGDPMVRQPEQRCQIW